MKARGLMKNILVDLFVLSFILPVITHSQFKVMMWYSEWDEQPYKAQGYGCPPWLIDWTGAGVIIHFDNNNVNDNASPYWAYVNKGNAFADSLYLFWGQNLDYNYVDSLTTIGHRYGAIVVTTIMQAGPTRLNNIIGDSMKIEALCAAVAQYCQRHHYDGVDLNYETTHSSRVNVARFLRRLRYNLNIYLTKYQRSLTRPWLSVTSPWQWAVASSMCYLPGDTAYVDMFNLQQGTQEWDVDYRGNNLTWYGIAVKLGVYGEGWDYAKANKLNLTSLSEDASWISNSFKPTGVRAAVAAGFPKSKIAPAFSLGGGAIKRGVNTALGIHGSYTADLKRCDINKLLAHGGYWYWDSSYQASSVRGTATANLPWPCNIKQGEKFFIAVADSQNAYYATDWLIKNGYGGIAPYSVSFDMDTNVPATVTWKHLPGHIGIFKAMVDNGLILNKQRYHPKLIRW